MGIYKVSIYDKEWRLVAEDYQRFDDRQQAELSAERDMDWLGAAHYEVTRIR